MKPQERLDLILTSALSPTERLVLVALSSFMGPECVAWPSVASLVERTGFTDRAIQKVLRTGVEAGWLVRTTGRHRAPDYQVAWGHLPKPNPRTTFTPNDVHPEPGSPRTTFAPNDVHPEPGSPDPRTTFALPPNDVHPIREGTGNGTGKGGFAREGSDLETEPQGPASETRCLPDDLHGLMPEARSDLLVKLVRVGHIESPEQLLALSVHELAHSSGLGWAVARQVEAQLAKGPWRMRTDEDAEPRARGRPGRAFGGRSPPPPTPAADHPRSADPSSPDFDPELLEELVLKGRHTPAEAK